MNKFPKRQKGFTLLELMIVVTIIGIIFAILVPNFLDSLQKAKQKRTMTNMGTVGRSMMSWLTDQVSAAAAGANNRTFDISIYPSPLDPAAVQAILVPLYLGYVPVNDAWGNPFEYRIETGSFNSAGVLAIRSRGLDGLFSGDTYTKSAFISTLYHEDLVWADGYFIRWPQNWQ